MGLWSRCELPKEETDEQDPERDREVETEGLISLSRPRDAMSSMKEGRSGMRWSMGRGLECLAMGGSYKAQSSWRRPTVVMHAK